MAAKRIVVFSTLLWISYATDLGFPPGFKFGVATASYEVEGAWNISDKGESIWDRKIHHTPETIFDGSNGDVACDSYHKYKEDVKLISNLGAHFYRFSISWPRVLPSGFSNHISKDGKNYYNNLINELLDNGIEPVATMYHWDLPQSLQDLGGWANPLIVDWFEDYSRVLYSLYADRVKTWITINEPLIVCDEPYNSGYLAPSIIDPNCALYLCNKNVLLAHAKAWRLYDKEYKPQYNGRVSISNVVIRYEGLTEEDYEAGELVNEYATGRYSHPIFSKEGGWPSIIEKAIAEKSKKEGYPRSKLPPFTEDEINLIKGTYDFYGINHYTSRLVRKAKPDEKLRPWTTGDLPELGLKIGLRHDWDIGTSGLIAIVPEGFRKVLNWVRNKYGDMEFIVTENGYCDSSPFNDDERIRYFAKYLEQMLLAIKEDGVNVTAYTAWSLLDNFEWVQGYSVKFGLHDVDFEDPERKRTERKSAHYYRSIIQSHSLDVPLDPVSWGNKKMKNIITVTNVTPINIDTLT